MLELAGSRIGEVKVQACVSGEIMILSSLHFLEVQLKCAYTYMFNVTYWCTTDKEKFPQHLHIGKYALFAFAVYNFQIF